MVDSVKTLGVLRQAIQLYADREGLTEAEATQIAEKCGEPLAQKVIGYLSDGIVTPNEVRELVRDAGIDGTKPLVQRLKFFKDNESKDLRKLSDQHPTETWLQTAIVVENGTNLSFLPESAQENRN